MIDCILINKVASYDENVEIKLNNVNFFYGSNGSGKTTISRLLRYNSYPESCKIVNSTRDEEYLVYNNDFVNENFNDNSMIKGIFTLGKDSNEALGKINSLEIEKKSLNDSIMKEERSLQKLKDSLNDEQKNLNDYCWSFKNDFNSNFKDFFVGKIGAKNSFAEFCLNLIKPTSIVEPVENLKLEYDKLFNKNLKFIEPIMINENIKFDQDKYNDVLKESIKGKDSSEISTFIEKLGNYDWVHSGVSFLQISNDRCPFCQQKIDETKYEAIVKIFDETYDAMLDTIANLKKEYADECVSIITNTYDIIERYEEYVEIDRLKTIVGNFKNEYEQNIKLFDLKIEKPSSVVELNIISYYQDILIELSHINELITENNDYFNNVESLKKELKSKVYLVLYLKIESFIKAHKKKIYGISAGITNVENKIKKLKEDVINIETQCAQIRSSMSGIANTIMEMNNILESFGFKDFYFTENADTRTYKIVRSNGKTVGATLSEGEQRFISFLYFYQLIKGTQNEDGLKKERVIVIDDPISSLDSNILFIISTLVKNIIDDCLKNTTNNVDVTVSHGINQVIVLTHNVYFMKEITFRSPKVKQFTENNTSYFIITKNNGVSNVKQYNSNPITTTYDLLWSELRPENYNKNKSTVFNTMRRILEYYFNVLGGLDYEKTLNQFEGEDKQLCASLISCINDSSHYITDDFSIVITDELIEKYINVFKLIFEKTGQIKHYEMMMNRK